MAPDTREAYARAVFEAMDVDGDGQVPSSSRRTVFSGFSEVFRTVFLPGPGCGAGALRGRTTQLLAGISLRHNMMHDF